MGPQAILSTKGVAVLWESNSEGLHCINKWSDINFNWPDTLAYIQHLIWNACKIESYCLWVSDQYFQSINEEIWEHNKTDNSDWTMKLNATQPQVNLGLIRDLLWTAHLINREERLK